QLNYSPDW
uniref:Adipokinetic hormone n=3 Tax=Scarabaeoidea TaxID=75546 RepID=AKH_ANOSE|nr:RecName: Full=Adipokinetic hormone; Short=AKH [Melolontha melolontha]P84241.1 RecName: Full=Adipokinetic hormone; Short=AKH [Anoplotrupes stercorosus]P84242.1 RecName: Full=Adipokinetic hormone; Short=AKH [Pachnoda marginata]